MIVVVVLLSQIYVGVTFKAALHSDPKGFAQ